MKCQLLYRRVYLIEYIYLYSTWFLWQKIARNFFSVVFVSDCKPLSPHTVCTPQEDLPAPVEACCQFLCKFARISPENQRALFDHIGYLLEHSEKHPGESPSEPGDTTHCAHVLIMCHTFSQA